MEKVNLLESWPRNGTYHFDLLAKDNHMATSKCKADGKVVVSHLP